MAAFALVENRDPRGAYEGSKETLGERDRDFGLGRLFPSFAALRDDGRFDELATRLVAPIAAWVASGSLVPHVARKGGRASATADA